MRIRSKTIFTRINKNGELSPFTLDVLEFLRLHANKNVIIRIDLQPTTPSERLTNFFFGYIVREMQNAVMEQGEHLSKEGTYNFIRKNCPLFLKEERKNGEWKVMLKEWEELDSAEAVEVIAWIQQWASENFGIILDDPN